MNDSAHLYSNNPDWDIDFLFSIFPGTVFEETAPDRN